MESGSTQSLCAANNCESGSVIDLSGQELCLEHYFVKCYERLDWVESIARSRRLEMDVASRAHALLRECANQTLIVCLHQHPQPLNNLQRSRLLEIMLHCTDLQVQLRRPSLQLT